MKNERLNGYHFNGMRGDIAYGIAQENAHDCGWQVSALCSGSASPRIATNHTYSKFYCNCNTENIRLTT